MTRDAALARYRHLRAISRQHHSAALKFLSQQTILDHARGLGLTVGKMLILDSEDELALAYDLAIHSPRYARSRAIDRYRKAAQLAPASDEARVLEAICQARFSIWRVERRHEIAGLVVCDLLRDTETWLMDENFERTADAGMAMAARLSQPEAFAMTCGVIVPVDRAIMEEVLDTELPRLRGAPAQVADNPRFAMSIYRVALASGALETVAFE